jgi:hypothetical protein
MPPSSFAVFVDTPVEAPKPPTVSKPDSSATIDISATVSAVLGVVALANKENLDPITGEKLKVPEAGKKRKNSLVVLKSVASVEGKGLKDASDSQPDAKKRKGLTRARSASASTLPLKRVSKPASTGTKRPAKKARRAPMPMLDEESETTAKASDAVTLTQSEIDSKCKELTVLPLADVSEAYDAASFLDPLGEEPLKDDDLDYARSPFVRVSRNIYVKYLTLSLT